MEPTENQQLAEEDLDKDCRLRHGLNVHCLAEIFQYLDYADLCTLHEMNDFYKQIIIDSVISKIEFQHNENATLLQQFERFGSKIRKLVFNEDATVQQLNEWITTFCSPDQLKEVTINRCFGDINGRNVDFPDYFRKVEKCHMSLADRTVSIQFSESLRKLRLVRCELSPNFDWTKLKNLTELHLNGVKGINVLNFIDFLRERPPLKSFKVSCSFHKSTRGDIYNVLGKYCGQYIQEFGDLHDDRSVKSPYFYNFVSDLKCVKTIQIQAGQICGTDMLNAIRRLAENNTLEKLKIFFWFSSYNPIEKCIFQENVNHESLDIKRFDHLKTIEVMFVLPIDSHGEECAPLKILTTFSSQILSNVENLLLDGDVFKNNLIKRSPKLRYLHLENWRLEMNDATEIVSELESILKNRINENRSDDFIEIISDQTNLEIFESVHDRSSAIKLIQRKE